MWVFRYRSVLPCDLHPVMIRFGLILAVTASLCVSAGNVSWSGSRLHPRGMFEPYFLQCQEFRPLWCNARLPRHPNPGIETFKLQTIKLQSPYLWVVYKKGHKDPKQGHNGYF